MMISFYVALALLLLYGILFQNYHSWWRAIKPFESDQSSRVTISVIIPARNEAANIAACLHAIGRQLYPLQLVQVIVLDDQSTDDTFRIAGTVSYDSLRIDCHKLPAMPDNKAPKKRAIETGIGLASGELIVTTDADCIAEPRWLQTLANAYRETNNVFLAAPVKIRSGKSVLSKFQALDFLTMQGITAAVVSRRLHNMCNGANLAYERRVFYDVNGFADIDHIASGDDMLLMNKIAVKFPGRLGYVQSPEAMVTTQPAASWKAFMQQRIRWASKATDYHQRGIFWVLLLVYLLNLLFFCFLVMAFFNATALILFFLFWISKFFMELFFVKDVATFFKQQQLVPWLFLLQPLHCIYIVVSGFLGLFKSYEWKGRKLK